MFMPKMVKVVTKTPAKNAPKLMSQKASLYLTPNKNAATEPVQIPVKGKGMATNATNAHFPHLLKLFSVFFLVLSKSQLKKRLKTPNCLLKYIDNLSKNQIIGIIGKIFPIKLKNNAFGQEK